MKKRNTLFGIAIIPIIITVASYDGNNCCIKTNPSRFHLLLVNNRLLLLSLGVMVTNGMILKKAMYKGIVLALPAYRQLLFLLA